VAARDPIGRFIRGLLQAAALACLASVLTPQSSAIAAPPSVTVSSPANGALGNDRTPDFAGVADVEAGPVTLRIYAGTSPEGTALQKPSTSLFSPEGAWTLHPTIPLADGVYTAQASQTNAAMQTGSSPPVTFTVDTAAPLVTLDPPEPTPGATAPAFTGSASDTRPVTVEIFAGSEETLVSTAAAAGTGARWRSSDASPPLAVGQYTAIAFQESSLTGNPEGRSQGMPFAIRSAPPPPSFLATANGTLALAGKPIEAVRPASLMAPFPVVRIAWAQERNGITLRLLRVQQTPAGAQVRVRCTGRGCPAQALRRTTLSGPRGVEPLTFRSLQRHLGFGAVLQLFVSKPGQIGKYTRFTVRRGRLPERVDTCLDPAGVRPLACPRA
jgi:hypothetical protein